MAAMVGFAFASSPGILAITSIGERSDDRLGIPSMGNADFAMMVMPMAASMP